MAGKRVLEFGDLIEIFKRFNLTRQKVLMVLSNPDLDQENYYKIIDYLEERDKVKSFFLDNEKDFKDISKSAINLKQKFDRNKNVTAYNVRNILENIVELHNLLNSMQNEYQRTFTEK